jgi:cellulose synthase (UDP-forming)
MLELWWWPVPAAISAVVVATIIVLGAVARRRPGLARRPIMLLTLATSVVYLVWRIGFTLPEPGGWGFIAGVVLLVAEIVGLSQVVSAVVLAWRPTLLPTPSLDALPRPPSVDVFIATYDEPLGVLEPTLAGAMGMRYPGDVTVYLCDDGSRPAVRELAARYGAVHLEREIHDHAKAGNLNNALKHSTGELVVTLDADMIPRADLLERMVGYFIDERLAFVQAPQAFHNEDPFQYNLFSGAALPNEQDLFMRGMQAGKSRFNAVMYVGSNTVFRRAALDDIGGFATGVITEDMATGMLLQAAGWRSTFVPHLVAAGLAPESFADLLVQRTRWSRGNIQTTRRWNPLTMPGLTPMQRWLYADGIVYWHFGILKLVFILAPLVWLLGGVSIVQTDIPSVAVVWLPYFAASLVSMSVISEGRRSFTWTHVYEVAMTPTIALAVIAEWVGLSQRAFAVTPKGVATDSFAFGVRVALPHIVLLCLSVLALLTAFVIVPERYSLDSLVVTAFWTIYNMIGLVFAILVCLERPRPRRQERTRVDAAATAQLWANRTSEGEVLDLSVGGARILLPWAEGFTAEDAVEAMLERPEIAVDGIGPLPGVVRRVEGTDRGLELGWEFAELGPKTMIALIGAISASPHWIGSDKERDASLRRSLRRTMSGVTRQSPQHARRELRMRADDTLRIVRSAVAASHPRRARRGGTSFTAQLVDLSASGCQVVTRAPLTKGEHVLIELDSVASASVGATVQWTQRQGLVLAAGLRFTAADAQGAAPVPSGAEGAAMVTW